LRGGGIHLFAHGEYFGSEGGITAGR
jgi:hypothetical protein